MLWIYPLMCKEKCGHSQQTHNTTVKEICMKQQSKCSQSNWNAIQSNCTRGKAQQSHCTGTATQGKRKAAELQNSSAAEGSLYKEENDVAIIITCYYLVVLIPRNYLETLLLRKLSFTSNTLSPQHPLWNTQTPKNHLKWRSMHLT